MGERQKKFWDGIWEKDDGDVRWDHDSWKKVSPEVIDLIKSQSPENRPNVLDLGCGLGRNSVAFAQAGFEVTAIDISQEAISHLKQWAEKLDLYIETFTSDFIQNVFSANTFDIVLSLNVIYHGHREQAATAISNIYGWLKKGGLFYFTFPTRQDGDYGTGKKLADHTFELESGHVHYHADEHDLNHLLSGFKILNQKIIESPWKDDSTRRYSRWHLWAEKV